MKARVRKSAVCVSLILLGVCLASLTAAASVQGSFQRTFQVTGPVDLEVLTRSGDITVRRGPAGTVTINGKIGVSRNWPFGTEKKAEVQALEKNPPLRQTGNSIRVDYTNVRNVWIDYEIIVPTDTKIRARSGSGDQTVEGLHGDIDLESGSGDMRLDDLTGNIHVRTGSGNVRARGMSGPVEAQAGSGDITVEEKGAGDDRVHTGSGNIELRGIRGGLHVQAGSGDVDAEGTQTGVWELRTGSGNVHLRLPAQAAFDLDASTSSGTVVVDHPVSMTIQGKVQEEHRSINGKVQGGGPLVSVHTGSGDVHIF